MAGATLLAFGSSAPEIIIGACGAASDRTELSIPTILVSALIAFGLIPPLVVGAVGPITLEGAGVYRDAIAYGLSVGLLLYFDRRREIGVYRAGILTVCYFVYLLFIWRTSPNKHQEAERARENLVGILEDGKGDKVHHSGEHRVSGGSCSSGRRVSTWLTALSEQDVDKQTGESLADPLLKTAVGKAHPPPHHDVKPWAQGANGKFHVCTPVSEGASPTASTFCQTPSTKEQGEQDRGVTPNFAGANGQGIGKSYEVESLVTMRVAEDLNSEIQGELKEGTAVRILEIGKSRRAKVAAGKLEGWVSLTTASGEVLIGKTEVEALVEGKACPGLVEENAELMGSEKLDEDSDEESNTPTTCFGHVMAILCRPFELLFETVMPENPSFGFLVCLVILALLSEGALYCAGILAEVWHLSGAISGMTLLAFGGQIPDAIAAVELARSGMADAAVAQAVASQVINITLGVGCPFFVYTLVTGLPTYNNHPRQIFTVAIALAVVIISYILVLVSGQSGGRITITWCQSMVLMASFGVCYVWALAAVEMGW
uniref:Sodium/calcium exchanger membrane region domain-containing protein n=1 Tax=Alexandrium catenella TaxID=2925 RepID=A0A7S1REI9_ALECA